MKFTKSALQSALFAVFTISAFSAQAALYPDLPVGIKSGTGALINDTVYVGLGTGGNKFFALNLQQEGAQWQEIAPFPGGDRNQPVSAAVDGKLYVFGGLQKNDKSELALVNDAYSYNPADNTWSKLPTRSPRGMVGAGAVSVDGKVYIIGGVNTAIFDGYFEDYVGADNDKAAQKTIAEAYFEQRPQDYFMTPELLSYEPTTNKWYNEGIFPFAPRSGATFTTDGKTLLVVNGEIKPGLRTASTEQGRFTASGIQWRKLSDLPAPAKDRAQDGLAGAMGGYSYGRYIVAGGANFPGSTKQFKLGKLFAHEGLSKAWHKEIYALNPKGGWRVVGELPNSIGYGVSVSYNDKVLLIGGETDGGK
ncbi:MAG TPA: N-acetylneuraminic acid mutarotase, partial [Pasteurellaceae bacterium]|nr:N-acetylneuraminic acid mutarotase [Pasteurellaceae bacterium]